VPGRGAHRGAARAGGRGRDHLSTARIAWLDASSGDSEITVAGRSKPSSASRSGSARSEEAEGRLLEALTDRALPTFEESREPLARQEIALALDGADGKSVLSRVLNIAQHGSPEAVACLIRTPFGRTLLASRGASGRDIDEALSTARRVSAVRAAEHGQTERQRQAGRALGQVGKLGAARTAARMHLNSIVG